MGQEAMPGRWGRTVAISVCNLEMCCRNRRGNSRYTYAIVSIYRGNAPCVVVAALANSLTRPLLGSIIKIPSIYLKLRRRRLICKCIQLFYPANLACPLLQSFVYITGLDLTREVETNEGKVSTAQANRRRLAGCGRGWAACTK